MNVKLTTLEKLRKKLKKYSFLNFFFYLSEDNVYNDSNFDSYAQFSKLVKNQFSTK
jgi:hypothetical protein